MSEISELRRIVGQAAEDYLKVIFEIAGADGRATTNQIADKLGIRPASVTGMLQRLASLERPLVIYNKHRGVGLTVEGQKIAIEIIRHHRLLELFLHETLGYSWDEVHHEADLLEHFISEKFEERIASALGNPQTDPHGDPIPTSDLEFLDEQPDLLILHNLRPHQRAVVHRVKSDDDDLLRHLASIELIPGNLVDVVDYLPLEDVLYIRVVSPTTHIPGDPLALSNHISKRIQVRLEK